MPFHDRTITVTACGRICFNGRKINLSGVFAGQNVGIKQIAEKVWLVSFMQYDPGLFDEESVRVECAPNPFEVKVLARPERFELPTPLFVGALVV
jgi:putative transposase